MTLRVGQVPGAAGSGTEFGRGTLKAQEPKADWKCPSCKAQNKGYWTRCFGVGCNRERP